MTNTVPYKPDEVSDLLSSIEFKSKLSRTDLEMQIIIGKIKYFQYGDLFEVRDHFDYWL